MEKLGPYIGTILFGKCPLFDVSKILDSTSEEHPRCLLRMSDEVTRELHCEKTLAKVPSQVEVRTCATQVTDSSSTMKSKDELLKAYRDEQCDETTLSSPLLINEGEQDERPIPMKESCEDEHRIEKGDEDFDPTSTKATECESEENEYSTEESKTHVTFEELPVQPDEEEESVKKKRKKNGRKRARVILPEGFGKGSGGGGVLRSDSFNTRLSHSATSQGATSRSQKSTLSRATSIASASKSVKSLPREIELEDIDEAADETNHDEESRDDTTGRRRPSRSKSQMQIIQVTQLMWTNGYGVQGTYSGSFAKSSQQPHGFGRFEHAEVLEWYEGEFRQGEKHGKGRTALANGDFYEGSFACGQEHGSGVKKFRDGRSFEGQFMHGEMAHGEMIYKDGSTYIGGWMNGMRHGRGTSMFSDNSVYVGAFRLGRFSGFGKMLWMDGGYYEGEWEDGEMNGYGKEILPNGNLRHEGQWSNGLPIRTSQ